MKRCFLILLCLLITGTACGCSSTRETFFAYSVDESYYSDNYYADETFDPYESQSVQYISDRDVDYYESDDWFIVFFGLKNENETLIDASGTADIEIKDQNGNSLYKQSIPFSEDDFTTWTSASWSNEKYLCGLYIDRADISGGTSTSGTLTLEVTCADGSHFSPSNLSISDLPEKRVTIKLPSVPKTLNDNSYSSKSLKVTVKKLSYESNLSYDGTADVTINMTIQLISKSGDTNTSETAHVGYKLYDSDNVVVDSGQFYSPPLEVGESALIDETIYNLDPTEVYTLKFFDSI